MLSSFLIYLGTPFLSALELLTSFSLNIFPNVKLNRFVPPYDLSSDNFCTHNWWLVQFTLVVDNFGVRYVGEEHAIQLKNIIEENYTLISEWYGRQYIGTALDLDYKRRQVHLSIPKYVTKDIKKFKHKLQKKKHQPYSSASIIYGAKKQYVTPQSTAPLFDEKGKKFTQQVCGKFIFLGLAVDSNLLCPISAIASHSATPTEDTMRQNQQLIYYIATQEKMF